MENSTQEKTKLGMFVLLGLALFVIAIYLIGNKQSMFGNNILIKATFSNVNGLQIGNNVRYSGIDIGTVKAIEMANDSVIEVTLAIQTKIAQHIKTDAIASITSDGLVGNRVINIIPGKKGVQPIQTGDYIQTYSRIGTDAILETLNVTNENAALLTADLLKITKKINEGTGTVGALLNDSLMAQDLKVSLQQIRKTTAGTQQTVEKLNAMLVSLDQKDNVVGVLKDTAVAGQIKKMVGTLHQSSKDISGAVTHLNQTILNVKEGQGALNYLSNNPKLVQQIDSTMILLNQAGIKLNQDLEALQHHFLFRGYFKKLEKEKQKEAKKQ